MSDKSFDEIAAEQGEEAAIQAGIAADPDTMELDEAWFARARPVRATHPLLSKHRGAGDPNGHTRTNTTEESSA